MTDDDRERAIDMLVQKWTIPREEAERMLENQRARVKE